MSTVRVLDLGWNKKIQGIINPNIPNSYPDIDKK